jgi:hypothetical protein
MDIGNDSFMVLCSVIEIAGSLRDKDLEAVKALHAMLADVPTANSFLG